MHNLVCGTHKYMAPELIKMTEYDAQKVDMWALGVLIYVGLIGKYPFDCKN